jgi:hypothetical protein
MRCARACGGAVTLLVLSWFTSTPLAHAQAWVPDVGDGTFALSAQYTRVMKHLFSVNVGGLVDPTSGYLLGPGNQGYLGDIVAMSNTISAEYVPVTRLAISSEVMYTAARYMGLSPEGAFDDGRFHGDLQDVVLGARYMLPVRALALTPSIDVRFPLTDYNPFGQVGAGTGLTSVALGLNTGRSLDPFAPLAYVFTNYARVIVEDVDGYSLDRNQVICGAGMFLTRALSAQAHFQYMDTMDGVDWWSGEPSHFHHHDVAAKAIVRRIGLSSGYSLTRRVGLAMSWESTVSGANVHAAHSATLGVSWGFWKKRPL